MDYNSIPFKNRDIDRLQKKEQKLVEKGNKAVDEGRERKAERLLGRAAKVENRVIKKSEKITGLEYEPRVRKKDIRKWSKEMGL